MRLLRLNLAEAHPRIAHQPRQGIPFETKEGPRPANAAPRTERVMVWNAPSATRRRPFSTGARATPWHS